MAYNPLVPVEECACAAPGEESAAPPPSSFDRNASVIQFSAAMYLCTEADGKLQVHVLRLGDSRQRARVYFSTKDASAKAGVKYEARSEMLVFEPGDIKKTVSITLLQDERWDATLEFEMTLSDVQNAALGLYLSTCRAKIIDDDLYPTNQSVDGLSGLGLMREYVKMNLGDPQVFRSTCLHLFFDLIKGLYLFLTFYLSMYLVDVVLSPGEEAARGKEEGEGAERRMLLSAIHGAAKHAARALGEDFGEEEGPGMVAHTLIIPGHRRSTAMVIAALYIVPFGLLHMVDLFRVWLEIPYRIRRTCQASLLSKFLHYRESSRSSLNVGGITMTMMRDTIEVCDLGYMKILRVLGILMKLLFAGIFILAENDKAFIPLVAYPVVLGLFLVARERKTIRVDEDRAHKQNEVVQVVSDMVANYRLIADFLLRRYAVDSYERTVDALHRSERDAQVVVTNSMYMAPWLTTLLIGGWICYGSFHITTFGGTISLGAFLATFNIFKEVGHELQEIYVECMEIQRSFGPLEKICHYMNWETDLFDRMGTAQDRQAHSEEMRHQARECLTRFDSGASLTSTGPSLNEDSSNPLFAVDSIDIKLRGLHYSYESKRVLEGVTATFPQGGIYAFSGLSHHGKATLLKLLGQVLLPEENDMIFIPPHLRVLHISQSQCLINDTFLQNVLLYASPEQVQGIDRVRTICRRVGLKAELLSHLETETPLREWQHLLSYTDFARLNLARAFVMNPECLVIHKPDMCFDVDEVMDILMLIRCHSRERGLELPPETRRYRRPRTVFFTCTTAEALDMADGIFEVNVLRDKTPRPLKITVIRAKNLPGQDTLRCSEAFVTCEVASKPHTGFSTSAVKYDGDIVWDHSGEIAQYDPDDILEFFVKDPASNKKGGFLGKAELSLQDLPTYGALRRLRIAFGGDRSKALLEVWVKTAPMHRPNLIGEEVADDAGGGAARVQPQTPQPAARK